MDSESQLSSSQYASRRKELLLLLKQLRATGAQGELDLPRITVIGNQSAGKSSVVEAISGINVPRDAGTCTRCPIECRLANSPGKWTCIISIRREYDTEGKLLEKVSEKRFGEVITEKKDVEPALRRAQMAILNPHISTNDFVHASDAELAGHRFNSEDTLKFSDDTICIDLEGPELTDLSFVDLPGLIQNADPALIEFVEELIVRHIKGNCLILVALPMTGKFSALLLVPSLNQPPDDIENQKAVRLARQEDPDGRRTIGVMTKPDMLTAGSKKAKDLWLDIIEGRRHPLAHGYFCTRQPDDLQRSEKITPAEARRCETEFFSTTAPWSTSSHKDRFGTNHLISSLSKHLVGIINDTLPGIMKEAASKLESCTRELATLPKDIDEDPATYMLKLLTGFSDEIHQAVYTGLDVNQLVHRNQETFREFKSVIRKTAPNFVPVDSNGDRKSQKASLESYEVDKIADGSPFYLNNMREHIRKSVTRELPNNVPFSSKVELITRFQASWESATDVCFQAVRKHVEKMLNRQVKNSFHRYEHLEGHVRIYVDEIVQKHFESCNRVLRPLLEAEGTPFTLNTHYLSESTAKWSSIYKSKRSGNFEQTDLPRAKRQKITNGDSAGSTTPPTASSGTFPFGGSATNASFTFAPSRPLNGTPSFASPAPTSSSTVQPAFGGLGPFGARPAVGSAAPASQASPSASASTSDDTLVNDDEVTERQRQINAAVAALAALGYHNISEADFGKMVPPDEYETEIQVMAEVRGYFQITYKRVIDMVPALIDLLFVRAIADDMQSSLITKFSLGTVDARERCARYLAENPMVVIRRKELTAQKHRLEEVRHALHSFGLA